MSIKGADTSRLGGDTQGAQIGDQGVEASEQGCPDGKDQKSVLATFLRAIMKKTSSHYNFILEIGADGKGVK